MHRKETKIKIIAIVCVFLSVMKLAADEAGGMENYIFYDPPSRSPFMDGYISENMRSISMDMALTGLFCFSFGDLGFIVQQDSLNESDRKSNVGRFVYVLGGMLPLSPFIPMPINLAIPLFVGGVFATSEDKTTTPKGEYHSEQYIISSGLVYYGELGVISGLMGYTGNLYWGIFPVINAHKFPLLASVVRLIDGNLRSDIGSFRPMYKANILFKKLHFDIAGKDTQWSINVFTERNWFNVDTKYDLYAATLGYNSLFYDNELILAFTTTIGYRDFFDTQRNHGFYESGGYVKITAGFFVNDMSGMAIQLSAESNVKSFLKGFNFGIYFGQGGTFPDIKSMVKGGFDIKLGANGVEMDLFSKLYAEDKIYTE